jgi:RHS repeat-associated protein
LTDSTGSVVNSYIYKSFGEIYSQTGAVQQSFTFTGREFDPESGFYYYRARYYDPKSGRFFTKDPIGFGGGDVNLFRYVGNNPVNWIDRSGLWPTEIHNRIIREAFRNLPFYLLDAIERGSAYADTLQSGKYAYMHAMRSWGQNIQEAQWAMDDYIKHHLNNYECMKEKRNIDAFFELGMALHPIMDSTSPSHEGFQVWDPLYMTGPSLFRHWLSEREMSEQQMQETINRINRTLSVYGINFR